MSELVLTGHSLRIADVINVSFHRRPVAVSDEASAAVAASHNIVRDKINKREVVYGITTGFGNLANVVIDPGQSALLQKNLIVSHACGVGEPFPTEVVRGIMLLRANALANGFSGVSPRCVSILTDMLNAGVHPIVPMKGSLGASGDLCHLAHVALVMMGMGEAELNGMRISGADAMEKAGITVLEPTGKDGLGLINGTQAMSAIGVFCVYDAIMLLELANACAALTLEALGGRIDAFDEKLHKARPHPGQIICAGELRRLLNGSKNTGSARRVQDAYTLRCVPQVHGASWDAINYAKNVLTIEINSVTDNPIVFPDSGEGQIISGGNFHGQPLALALDFLAIAVAELASISERRTERLVNPQLSGLPGFLTQNPGVNSGMMIPQYTAACLVSENKVLAHPASVDSIPSSANQEDHVSMGAISARKCSEIINNVKYVLAIELMAAAQAVDIGGSVNGLGDYTSKLYREIRKAVPRLDDDRVLSPDIEKIAALIDDGALNRVIEED
ncbi:MAG: histidine ammonia-lyase [Defluviitaleaceae bacterium]|nr:histidine ammonia-lyase [Defluviitaleaceae bacterium]MCL2836438.1 histidine ammonia-lyase [Defluviitaleaceae bacterium]